MEKLNEAEELYSEAKTLHVQGDYYSSHKLFGQTLEMWHEALGDPRTSKVEKTMIMEYFKSYHNFMHNWLTNSSAPTDQGKSIQAEPVPKERKSKREVSDDEMKEEFRKCIIPDPKDEWTMPPLIGLTKVVESMKESALYPMTLPKLIPSTFSWSGVLMFGPMGVGKSYCMRVLIKDVNDELKSEYLESPVGPAPLKVTMMQVRMDQIMSKWVGETEKSISNLFQVARELKPTLIFIDEIDSLCSERSTDDANFLRRMKNAFLAEMDGISNSPGVVVVGATNCPNVFDPAFLRRFQKRIYVPLPNTIERKLLFQTMLEEFQSTSLHEKELDDLSSVTEGYSGSDIKAVLSEAAYEVFRSEYLPATHFKRKGRGPLVPCKSNEGGMPMKIMNVPGRAQLTLRDMTLDDIKRGIRVIRPTNSLETTMKLEYWASTYATDFQLSTLGNQGANPGMWKITQMFMQCFCDC